MIKGLKKYYSPSEMYKYLVDQLWENDATEKLIRQTIQEEIRSDVTVMCYYKELLKLLTDSLVIDETQKTVYDGIFRKACEAFVVKKKK